MGREEVGLHSTPEPRQCVVFSTSFTPKRADAKTCSGKCRTKLSRQTIFPTTP